MSDKEIMIWVEMARRKVQFHANTEWDKIELWGLFSWGTVSFLIKKGDLLTNYTKENKTIWVKPTKESWENKILPLIKSFKLEKLTTMAGW